MPRTTKERPMTLARAMAIPYFTSGGLGKEVNHLRGTGWRLGPGGWQDTDQIIVQVEFDQRQPFVAQTRFVAAIPLIKPVTWRLASRVYPDDPSLSREPADYMGKPIKIFESGLSASGGFRALILADNRVLVLHRETIIHVANDVLEGFRWIYANHPYQRRAGDCATCDRPLAESDYGEHAYPLLNRAEGPGAPEWDRFGFGIQSLGGRPVLAWQRNAMTGTRFEPPILCLEPGTELQALRDHLDKSPTKALPAALVQILRARLDALGVHGATPEDT